MNITQTKLLKLFGLGIFFVFAFNVFGAAPSASAYTCEKSGPNKDGKAAGGQKLEYMNGTCGFMKPDEEANDQRTPIYNKDGTFSGRYECRNGTVLHSDGNCYTYRPEYTTEKPTYDDGTEVPQATWDQICENMPDYYGAGSHYNSENHACEVRANCDYQDKDSSGRGCRKIGDGTSSPGEVAKDTTKDKVNRKNECAANEGAWDDAATNSDGTTGKCNVTEKWCENKLEGEWKVDPATGQGKCEGGKDPNATPPASTPGAPNNTDTTGTCGRAKTVLLPSSTITECQAKTSDGETDGVTVLMGILKFILSILTIGVGVVAVGSIAYASILYASARDSSSQTQQAIGIIRNTVIGLLLYVFMVAILNYLVPGGVIG